MNHRATVYLFLKIAAVSAHAAAIKSSPLNNGIAVGNAINGNPLLEAFFSLVGVGGLILAVYAAYSSYQGPVRDEGSETQSQHAHRHDKDKRDR